MNNIDADSIILYTVNDIQRIFHIGRTKAYELMSANGFPSFRMNSRMYVEQNELRSWINKRQGKSFSY